MKKIALLALLLAAPLVAAAQTINTVLIRIGDIINIIIPLLIAIALVVFFWGLVKYIWSAGEEHAKGQQIMIAGLVSLFLMVSVFGIIRLVGNTFGVFGGNNTFIAPGVQLR